MYPSKELCLELIIDIHEDHLYFEERGLGQTTSPRDA